MKPQSGSDRRKISVVVPTLNEEGNVESLYERVVAVFENVLTVYDWELVFTDNRSTDATFRILTELAARDGRVRAYRFARNYGYQRSILTGYLLSSSDAVVQLDADMQDPPELIPELVERWEAGAKVVYGIRRSRSGERRLMTAARRAFYRTINWLSDEDLPADAGDFRLLDRVVVEVLRHHHDANPYLRGTIASMGFEQVGFEYDRDDRASGETKFRFRSLVRLAVDGILNHSTRPLHLATATSVIVVVIAFVAIVVYLSARLLFGQDWPAGFVTLALLQLIAILLNAAFLGILGGYIGRMFTQGRAAPIVVIEASAPDEPPSVLVAKGPTEHHQIIRVTEKGQHHE